jgi:hypothetical protein
VAVEAANVGRTINVSFAPQESVSLVPLLSSLGKRPTTTAVAGVDRHGVPVILNLGDEATWHVVMLSDGGPQKSDWLRCLVASLALASKPSELQLLGVDLSGVELAFIDALPQALTDVAFRADTAIDLLAWLRDETDRRRALNRKAPQLVLVIDDLAALVRQTGKAALSLANRLFRVGPQAGVHIVAGWGGGSARWLQELQTGAACLRATALTSGMGGLRTASYGTHLSDRGWTLQCACLPVPDLDRVVRKVRALHAPAQKRANP